MKRLILIVTLFAAMTVQAQENTFWKKVDHFLTKQANVDTTFIYHPRTGLSLGLFSTGQKAGFHVDVGFDLKDDDDTISGVTKYSLSENLCTKVGLEVGYGNVVVGYGFEVGRRSAHKKRSFAVNILGRSWGVHFNYFNISNPFTSGIVIGKEGDAIYWHDDWTSNELATLRSLTLDGYYVFNSKRFAYPATYKVGLVQRRTAGSWMVTARYMQGSLYSSPEASLDSYNLLDCFSTMQASIGGGYSVNFVLWHKDPTAKRDKGLRNLTLNLTAMPVLTVYNYLRTSSYLYDEDGNHYDVDGSCYGEKITKVLCRPMPNFVGSAALAFTWNRFFLSTQFAYNRFYFRSRDALDVTLFDYSEFEIDNLSVVGTFHDWTLKGLLVYKF